MKFNEIEDFGVIFLDVHHHLCETFLQVVICRL